MTELTPPADVSVDIPPRSGQPQRRMLYRVPPQLKEDRKHVYDPVVVPIGPYHHGREPHFQVAEQLKNEVRDIVCSAEDKGFLLNKILERMGDIRHFYGGADGYCDEELAEMMLRDACFMFCFIEGRENFGFIYGRLGMSGEMFMYRDVFMLENQIPLWLINLFISLIYNNDERGQSLLCRYLSYDTLGDEYRMKRLPWGNGEEEPLHLLEAVHRVLRYGAEDSSTISRDFNKYSQPREKVKSRRIFRSVTDLKAKGIRFRPSSQCLTDIKFLSFAFFGQLQLPSFYVSYNCPVFFANVIAFEMSPETETDLGVTSYVNFMKTLIEKASDVKELREKGILNSLLPSDEDVVRMFKAIDTYGFRNDDLFDEVKMRMEEHCNNKAKTWIADLIDTKFQSPWTAIALAAAAFLLCLTFIQTYFTINPRIT